MRILFQRFFSVWIVTALAFSCKTPREQANETLSSTDPLERTENSQSNVPEFAMTRELLDVTRRLTNHLNTCWLQAGLKELEITYYREKKAAIPFSAEYMMLVAMHDRFLRIIQGGKVVTTELEAGGEMNEVRSLIRTYGLVPESTWSQKGNAWDIMAKSLNPIAEKYKKANKLRPNAISDDVRKAAEADFSATLTKHDVHVPTWFNIDGKKTDPVTFAHAFAPENPDDFVMYIPAPQFAGYRTPDLAALGTRQKSYMTSWVNIQKTIVDQINKKRSVLTSIIWSEKKAITIDKQGIMHVQIPFPKEGQEGHVVNVVGYHLDDKGKIDRVKIENTWGRYSGPAGFYVVSWKEFEVIFVGISVPDGFSFAEKEGMSGVKIVR